MKNLVGLFWYKLRLSKPWNAKVPFLISILYFFIILGSISIKQVGESFLASIVLIIGFAGLAYTLNDLGDKNSDKQANKPNAMASQSRFQLGLLLVFFILLITLPWVYLPFDRMSVVLILTEMSLFFVYALPPFRLKEHGWFGALCDALYGHVIPAALAINTYSQLSQTPINNYWLFVLPILAWQFILGLRNIIFHQLQDYENDLNSSTNTLVIKLGMQASIKIVIRLLCTEFIFFVAFCWMLFYFFDLKIYLIAFVGYLFFTYYNVRQSFQAMNYRAKAYVFLDDFYIQWLPLLTLYLCVILNPWYLWLSLLHVLLFKNKIKSKCMALINNWYN